VWRIHQSGEEIGCSIVETKPLRTNLKELVFWHMVRRLKEVAKLAYSMTDGHFLQISLA
jgi:hypothetical protein